MKLSASTGLYYKTKTGEAILDLLQEAGYEDLELFLNHAFVDWDVQRIARETEKRGLKVASLHTPLEFIAFARREDEAFWIERCMSMANLLGAGLVNSHMVLGENVFRPMRTLEEEHLDNLARYGSQSVVLTTENLPAACTSTLLGDFDRFASLVLQRKLPITFDVTHFASYGLALLPSFERLRPLVRNIHLSDYADGAEHKTLGEGKLPLREFLRELARTDYAGLLTVELDFENPARNRIENDAQALDALKRSREFVLQEIG
ncbi:MAG: TIM barrel protein [Eubacteriales bacterium]|nr:TIM barrel protein [Eubacteriales bacterium]